MADIASLGIKIDSSQAKQATSDLDALAAAGTKTEAALDKLDGTGVKIDSKSTKDAVADLNNLATASKTASKSLNDASTAGQSYGQRMTALLAASRQGKQAQVEFNAEQEKFISGLQRQVETVGLSKAKLLEFKAAELGVGDSAKTLISQLSAAEAGFAKQKAAAAAAAHSLEGFSLSSSVARRELLVMTRELARGDFTRLSSSASIFAQSSGLVTAAMSPMGLAIIAVTSAVAGLAVAYELGAKQSKDFANALILTGNYAGITEGQFNDLAASIAKSTDSTIGSARDVAQELLKSGKFTNESIGSTAKAVELLSKASGQSADEIVKDFVSMANGVTEWATKHNEQYHFLTAAQLDYIKTLEDQGEKQKAIKVTMDALTASISGTTQNLGSLERGWQGVKNAASEAIDAMLQIGRVKTPEQQIASIKKQIADTKRGATGSGLVGADGEAIQLGGANVDALEEQLRILQKGKDAVEATTAAKAQAAQQNLKDIEVDKLGLQYMEKSLKIAKERADLVKKLQNDGASPEKTRAILAGFDEQNKGPKGAKAVDTSRQDDHAQLALDLEQFKKDSEARVNTLNNTEKLLEARRSAGLVDERDYYDQKKQLLDKNDAVQEESLQKQIARLQEETFTGKNATKDELDNARKIIDLQAQLSKVRENAATSQQVLDLQAARAINAVAAALLSARQAAQDYFDTVNRGYAREIANVGKGDKAAAFDASISQIEERYQQQRTNLQNQRAQAQALAGGQLTALAQKQFDDQLDIINEFQAKSIESFKDKYATLDAMQKDWANGAKQALANYADESANTMKLTQTAVTNAFQGMEDALVDFVTTGKLDFKKLVDSILADIARIAIKQAVTGPLAGALGGALGGGSSGAAGGLGGLLSGLFGGGGGSAGGGLASATADQLAKAGPGIMFFANGGDPPVGRPSIVGEKGPELFIPKTAGTIIPNGALATMGQGGGGNTVHVSINQTFAEGTTRKTADQAALAASNAIRRAQRNA